MPWKEENGKITVEDGHPVWIYDDGKESPFDAGSALNKIRDITAESMSRKATVRDLTDKLAPFSEIEDAEKFMTDAKTAIETVNNFKDKDFIEAAEVEQLKRGVADAFTKQIAEMKKSYETSVNEKSASLKASEESIKNLLVRGAFDQAEFIRENTVLSASIAFDTFGKMFQIEEIDGKPTAVGTRHNGEKIFSLKNAGSYATPDEAIEILVKEHPDKDVIMKGTPGGGGMGSGKFVKGVDTSNMTPRERLDAHRGIEV